MRGLATAALALLASGCATIAPPVATRDWSSRQAELQALEEWQFDGRIALAAGNEGFSGGVDWRQDGAAADITLRGPMGGSALVIHVDGGEYVVTDRSGRTHDGPQARRYLADRFGAPVELPVSEMRYWLVGVPAPGAPHRATFGDDQRLALLDQSGWRVEYERYASVGALALPQRIEMTSGNLRLRVVVSDWQPGS